MKPAKAEIDIVYAIGQGESTSDALRDIAEALEKEPRIEAELVKIKLDINHNRTYRNI